MADYGIAHSRARRTAWRRMLDVKMTTCELTVCVGGAMLVAFIAAMVGIAA
jgi:hypothetical protein